jgi:hypothetical protein
LFLKFSMYGCFYWLPKYFEDYLHFSQVSFESFNPLIIGLSCKLHHPFRCRLHLWQPRSRSRLRFRPNKEPDVLSSHLIRYPFLYRNELYHP